MEQGIHIPNLKILYCKEKKIKLNIDNVKLYENLCQLENVTLLTSYTS